MTGAARSRRCGRPNAGGVQQVALCIKLYMYVLYISISIYLSIYTYTYTYIYII